MSGFLVGQRLNLQVTITDKATGNAVDPATFLFTLKPPSVAAYTYSWNGATWTNSEAVVGLPTKATGTGVFNLEITVPYANASAGDWYVGWKHTENGSDLGEGSGETAFKIAASKVL